jgi:glycerol kinase
VWSDGAAATHVIEGTINGAGSALRWIGEELGIGDVEAELEGWLRSQSEPPLFLNGVSGLAAPFWVPSFHSRFVGEGDAAQKSAAVLESVVFLAATILAEMEIELTRPVRILASGGLARLDGLCERLASVSGIPVDRALEPEATARGLAWLLSGAKESWPDRDPPRRFAPIEDPLLAVRYRRWRDEMELSLRSQR